MSGEPSNFSWVSESVAGFAFPYYKSDAEFLQNEAKISHVITMCHEKPEELLKHTKIIHHHLPVDDMSPAELPVIQKAIEIIKEAEKRNEKVGVHCQLGMGRAGTILACYLAFKHGYDYKTALAKLRSTRPGSVDSTQVAAVKTYVESIK